MEMEFGRLDGFVTLTADGQRWMTVVLDTGREVETVRDEVVPPEMADQDSAWLADQFVLEALGNELSFEGWEVVGEGDTSGEEHRMLDVVARSRTWVIKRPT
jgi:hypothetical protein